MEEMAPSTADPVIPAFTDQQKSLLEQRYQVLSLVHQAAGSLDTKLTTLLGIGGLISGLMGVAIARQPAGGLSEDPKVISVLLALALLTFVMMVVITVWAWSPKDYATPGAEDWDAMFDTVVNAEPDDAYNHLLSDCTEAIDQGSVVNDAKVRALRWSAALLVLQVVMLALAIMGPELGPVLRAAGGALR